MKAIVNTAPNQLEMLEYPLPQPGRGQVRIRSGVCGICATDLELIAGWERTGYPTTPGHEWAGTVDAVGEDVPSRLIGVRCVAENVLSDGGEVGFEHPGAYGEYFLTEARNVHELPAGCSLATAALIEPLAVVVRAIKRLRMDKRQGVLISGDGPIGLLMLMVLHHRRVGPIVMIGGRAGRLALACELGAAAVFNYLQAGDDLVSTVQQQCGTDFPNVIEASGSAVGLRNAFRLVSREGQILLVGDYGAACAGFRWNFLLHHEVELIGSNASAGAWADAVHLATEGHLPLHRLISHRFPAARFDEAFALVRSQQADIVKVILEW